MRNTQFKPPPGRSKVLAVAALWLLSILYTFTARAEEACPAIRLDETPALRNIPRWDQEDSFLCYAFSASVLIDARLGGAPTSPLALAADTVIYSQTKRQRSSFWGGRIEQSIQVANERGRCQAGPLSDRFGRKGLKEMLPHIRALQKEARGASPALATEKLTSYLNEAGMGEYITSQILKRFLTATQDEFLAELIGIACKERATADLELLTEDRSFRPDKVTFANRISGVLNAGSPLAAEFCAEVVTDPKFSPGYNSICSRHYVTVVGQRPGDRCELLIRDSQCSQYQAKAGNSGCVDSHYWIDRRAFLSNTQAVHWLK
jgi:hypothetical protein